MAWLWNSFKSLCVGSIFLLGVLIMESVLLPREIVNMPFREYGAIVFWGGYLLHLLLACYVHGWAATLGNPSTTGGYMVRSSS